MWIFIWDKKLKELYVGTTKIKEVYHWETKVRPGDPWYNLDLDNGQPIGRMNDWELWFRVNVKDANEPFKIAVNGYTGTPYDWDVSVDGNAPTRYKGSKSTTPIELQMPVGKHYVKIVPHNWVMVGRARCIGNGSYNNYRNTDPTKLEFGLEWLPWYAFMMGESDVAMRFLYYTWGKCTTITSMPAWFNLPQGITKVGNEFLSGTWQGCTSLKFIYDWFNLPQDITETEIKFLDSTWRDCTSLTSIPSSFKFPQGITKVKFAFANFTWFNCKLLTSDSPAEPLVFPNVRIGIYASNCFWGSCPISPDTPTPWSSVMIKRNS